jgi:RNA recognition motif-containing protein
MRLYIGNLSYGTTDEGLLAAFAECGDVASASVVSDRDSGRSRGFGFVEMSDAAGGQTAIERWHGMELDGREIRVEQAKERQDRDSAL